MKKWIVHFRYISPNDYNTPSMYLPAQRMGGITANNPDEAWANFLKNVPVGDPDEYRKLREPEIQSEN